jgi:hypothetical protein
VLQACTVLGQNSTVERIEGVLEYPSHELLGAIQELSAAGMLICSADSTEHFPLSLRTRHDLLSSAIIESMSSASRAFLHRKAGLVLEKELSGDRISTTVLWACAFHWHHAGDRDRALSVARSCAEHLLELGLPHDASDALDRALEYCSTDEQRIALLTRQVGVLQMGGRWEQSKRVLCACRELRAKINDSSDQHDTFEIMQFEASFRTSLNVMDVLPDVMRCVECKDATAEHRIQAAVIALKLATHFDEAVMDAVYHEVEPLFDQAGTNHLSRIEAEMVYHSIRGDPNKGLAAARSLVNLARQSGDVAHLVRTLINAANSTRINGTDTDAEEYFREAIERSLKHHMLERAKIAMQCLVRLRLSRGDVVSARTILERSKALAVSPDHWPSNTEEHVLEALVALEEGEIAKAAKAFSKVREVLSGASGGRRVTGLSLEVRLRLVTGRDLEGLAPIVADLEETQRKLRSTGLQDFETESLFLGLQATGQESRGLALVDDYVRSYRRDLSPVPPLLAAIAGHSTVAASAIN